MSDTRSMLKRMLDAPTEASDECNGTPHNHDFYFFAHADGPETYTQYFKCGRCSEIVKHEQARTGENLTLWSDEGR